MVTPTGLYQTPVAAPPNWFNRNWKWALPVGVLLLLLLLLAFVGTIFLIVETSFQHSDPYIHGLARARANPRVMEKIGQPLAPGWLVSGNINISGPSGNADISIPVSGPKGKGTIYVVAKKSAGEWTFQTLQVEVEGQPERIDLLTGEGVPEEGK
jgi:Cytochrome oxidase complex assembly protein 1